MQLKQSGTLNNHLTIVAIKPEVEHLYTKKFKTDVNERSQKIHRLSSQLSDELDHHLERVHAGVEDNYEEVRRVLHTSDSSS